MIELNKKHGLEHRTLKKSISDQQLQFESLKKFRNEKAN